MNLLERAQSANYRRRVDALASCIADVLPPEGTVLDVGCGDGLISACIMVSKANILITGCEVLVRERVHIPVRQFNGYELPFESKSFDFVVFVDVLHHTAAQSELLEEAKRVARRAIIIKDHLGNSPMARRLLRWMDDAGNARYSVSLPYEYWTTTRWLAEFSRHGLSVQSWLADIPIYPWWASWLLGRGLHFMAVLRMDDEA